MGWSPHVAVAHYPEGAGHATRMLAIANELETGGARVSLAGGGAGSRFVELNGYDAFEPRVVDYIDTYQHGARREVFTRSLPATAGRLSDCVEWLREEDPDALVTDDMFAAMAARRVGVPQYVLKHDLPGMYEDPVERAGAGFHTRFQLAAARAFFQPAVWTETGDEPDAVTRVPPVALEGCPEGRAAAERRDPDVVVVPSAYSDLSRVATQLERQGYDVVDVGSDEWEAVPSLLPYLEVADLVVCSGYSTVMDAAVAGTPCVVRPATDEQWAVAERLADPEVTGFTVADGPLDVLDAAAEPPTTPRFENGASVVAKRVLSDLERRFREETSPDGSDQGRLQGVRRTVEEVRRTATASLALVGAAALFIRAGSVASGYRLLQLTRSTAARSVGLAQSAAARGRAGADRMLEPNS